MEDKNKKIRQADSTRRAHLDNPKSATEYESDWELVKQTEGLDDSEDSKAKSNKRKDASAQEESSKEGKRMSECGCKYF